MASKFKVWIEPAGMNAVRNSPEVQKWLEETGNAIAGRANGDYRVEVKTGKTRAHCNVIADSVATYYDNLKNNSLLKAMK